MKKIKNCTVEGIEIVSGVRRSDNQPFRYRRLHCLYPLPYGNQYEGQGSLSCSISDDEFREDGIELGSTITVISAIENGITRYSYGYAEN